MISEKLPQADLRQFLCFVDSNSLDILSVLRYHEEKTERACGLMDENFKIGNLIAERRREIGLSQAELGDRLHVTNKAVSRWETGRGLPDSSLLLPLSNILGITVDELLRGELITTVIEDPTSEADSSHAAEAQEIIQSRNLLYEYRGAKKQLIRDSLIVIPTLVFLLFWFLVAWYPGVDLLLDLDYPTAYWIRVGVPLIILEAAQIAYAVFLIRDSIRMQGRSVLAKIAIGIGLWYAVTYLFFFVYLYRIVRFVRLRYRMGRDRNGKAE